MRGWLAAGVLGAVVLGGTAYALLLPRSDPIDLIGTVTWVEDGDTACVELSRPPPTGALEDRCELPDAPPGHNDWPVRLIGIDAPELTPSVECFAREATEALRSMIEGQEVSLELDPGQLVDDTEYRRILAYVWMDQDFINERMVRGGFARERHTFPGVEVRTFVHRDRLVAAEEQARLEGLGIWSACQLASDTTENQTPIARIQVCTPDNECVVSGETLVIDPDGLMLSFNALADSDPSNDPDGDPLGFEWLINGELVSTAPSFEFDSSLLVVGEDNHVFLRVGDDKASVSEAGATISVRAASQSPRAVIVDPPTDGVEVRLCREHLDGSASLGSRSIEGNGDQEPGVLSRVDIRIDDSGNYQNWPIEMDLYDNLGQLLYRVGDLSRATLSGIDKPMAMGGIVDATGDLRPDAVICLGGTFNGGWDVQVLVISDHSGRWQTVLEENAVNGVVDVMTPETMITETFTYMLGSCTDITTLLYEFSGASFQLVSEEIVHDWTIPECDPDYSPPTTSLDNPHNMIVGWTDLGVGPGGTIEVDGPPDENSNVVFSVDCYDAECPLFFWYVDGVEVGRGDYVLVEASQIAEGTHEVRLMFNEPEGIPWEGTVTLIRSY